MVTVKLKLPTCLCIIIMFNELTNDPNNWKNDNHYSFTGCSEAGQKGKGWGNL